MPASLSQAVGSQTTLPLGNLPTSRITPLWGKGDPPISVAGMLPRPLRKTQAGRNMWQHTCSLESPEFKDTLLIDRAKKGSECTPEDHTIISCALKHEKAQACASQPTPFVIPSGITKKLTSMVQTWLMNEAACPPAVRQEPDNTLNLRDVDCYPLPLITDLLDVPRKAQIYTKINFQHAYHLVWIAKGNEWKMVFWTCYSFFEWLVMPFRLTNGPTVFQ